MNCKKLISSVVIFILLVLNTLVSVKSIKFNFLQQRLQSEYISNLVSNHFSHCTLILANTELLHKQNWNLDAQFIVSFLLFQASNTFYLASFHVTTSSSLQLNESSRLQRFSTYSKLFIAVNTRIQPNFSDLFLSMFTPNDNEITKRDEDFYIFVAENEHISTFLLHSHLFYQVRFKIVIYSSANSSIVVKSLCIYCLTDKVKNVSPDSSSHLKLIFPDYTSNFHQHPLRISGPTKYKATYEMEEVNNLYRNKRGIHSLIFNTVADKLNLTYTLHPCTKFGTIPKGSSGVLLANGTWAGCMGDVINNITDMSLSVSPDHKRIKFVHFTNAMVYTYVTFTTSKPTLYYSWTTTFTTFPPVVWAMVFGTVILATVTIHFIDDITLKRWAILDPQSSTGTSSMFETGLYLFGYLLGQDVPSPVSKASKFTYLCWLYFGLVLGTMYVCTLQALIVSPDFNVVPKTFAQLVGFHDYKWGAASAFRDGLGEQVFKSSDNPVMREIYHKMQGDKDEVTCTQKVTTGTYACFNWELMQQFHFKTTFADKGGNHPFQSAPDSAFFTSLNFITRKREIFRSHFNRFITTSFDSGLIKETIARDWRAYRMQVVEAVRQGNLTKFTPMYKDDSPQPFGLEIVKGSFYILGIGVGVSCLSFVLETIFRGLFRSKGNLEMTDKPSFTVMHENDEISFQHGFSLAFLFKTLKWKNSSSNKNPAFD